eukprot:CAMPEP_0176256724 /NCGR_PEP_ID=MMETSP0121_2-20121125/37688_1 /TAXON_ID=160619 /ORGANISM="Kryptoperidinium foliaceum, Strain CCMP 1326" /LENGTH=60 /DNA_ID=CAMNT_0017596559 /DNA_START=11 /DNA_END=193 /DNA_ORIENTATION=-
MRSSTARVGDPSLRPVQPGVGRILRRAPAAPPRTRSDHISREPEGAAPRASVPGTVPACL